MKYSSQGARATKVEFAAIWEALTGMHELEAHPGIHVPVSLDVGVDVGLL